MIEHSIYDVTTDSMWTLLFILWTCPNITIQVPYSSLNMDHGPFVYFVSLLLCMVFILFFCCSFSLSCHFVIIFIDFCVFFPGEMVRGRSYRCRTGGSHWCCILCIAQGHRFVNQSLRTILVNWWEFMAWGLLVWNRHSLKI